MHIDYMNLAAIIHALDMCHITVVSRVAYTLNTIAWEADTAKYGFTQNPKNIKT